MKIFHNTNRWNWALFFEILLLSLLSCTEDSKIDELDIAISKATRIEIPEQVSSSSKSSLGKIFDFNKFILLESDSLNLLADLNKIIIYKGVIYILDEKQSCLKTYNLNGKFLKNVTSIGKGPGEVTRLIDFCIDKKNDKLILYDIGNAAVQFYSVHGEFEKQIKFFPYFMKMDILKPGVLVFYTGNNYFDEAGARNFVSCNYEGKILDGILPFDKESCQLYAFGGIMTPMNDEILCTNGVSNLVYSLKTTQQGKLQTSPMYYLDFGKKGLIEGDCKTFNAEWKNSKLRYLYSDFYKINNDVFFDYLDQNRFKRSFFINGTMTTEDDLIDDYWYRLIGPMIGVYNEKIMFNIKPENIFDLFQNKKNFLDSLKRSNTLLYDLVCKAHLNENCIIAIGEMNKKQDYE